MRGSQQLKPSLRSLRWVNAAVFLAQRLLNTHYSRGVGPSSRRHETLITPAGYAFMIWKVIYLLLTLGVIVDCFCPVLSAFSYMDDPLRLLFTAACVANMAWTVAFPTGYINVATCVLSVQWIALCILFIQIIKTRREYGFSLARYICSELGLTMYFAWSSAATLISIAVTLQDLVVVPSGAYLPITAYLVLVSVLAVATISIVVFTNDITFATVAVWALVAVAVKDVHGLDQATQQVSFGVRAVATQSAAIIGAFIFISIARKLHNRFMPKYRNEPVERTLPLLTEKTLSVDYGYGATAV